MRSIDFDYIYKHIMYMYIVHMSSFKNKILIFSYFLNE